jgi:hypothetical protein
MKKPLIALLTAAFTFLAFTLMASGGHGGGSTEKRVGKGTDPIHFDDKTLMYTPTPVPTAIIKQSKEEIDTFDYLRETKSIIEKTQVNLVRYEKLIRKEMDSNLLTMKKLIAEMHITGLLHDRDKIEHKWAAAVSETEDTLLLGEGFVEEFNADIKVADSYQKKMLRLLEKKPGAFQLPKEAEQRFDMNKKELFFMEKKVHKFNKFYETYKYHFNKTLTEKEAKIRKLIGDHEELHKP